VGADDERVQQIDMLGWYKYRSGHRPQIVPKIDDKGIRIEVQDKYNWAFAKTNRITA